MKETPILFSTEMVRAILENRKSQTRRIAKFEPLEPGLNLDFSGLKAGYYCTNAPNSGWVLYSRDGTGTWNQRTKRLFCPYGQPGDRLILLCTWAAPKEYDKVKPSRLPKDVQIWSLFDGEKPEWAGRLRPGRFMPKWMRSQMPKGEILDIRVERIQDITEGDAEAEGVDPMTVLPGDQDCYIGTFALLWQELNFKRGFGWEANPWVWAIRFNVL